MTVLIIHTVNDKVGVYVSSVYMGGNKYLMPFPCFRTLGKLDCVLMSLLWCDMLVLMVAVYEVLIGSAPSLAPQLLGGLHFVLYCIWFTVQTADKLILCLFLFCHIVQCYHKDEKITPEQAHRNALQLAENTSAWKGFEVLVATHKDKKHKQVADHVSDYTDSIFKSRHRASTGLCDQRGKNRR